MKLYCVFKEEYYNYMEAEFLLDNVYTTRPAAETRVEKLMDRGIESYIIVKSLKGNITDFFIAFAQKEVNKIGNKNKKFKNAKIHLKKIK